jgi:hypothetical protein
MFATQAGVGAALTGLVFVALSINLKQILDVPGLAGRAAEALFLLVLPIFVGLAGVLPQTSVRAFGIEILVIGIIQFGAVTAFVRSGYAPSRGRPAREYRVRSVLAEVAVTPTVVAGVLMVAGHPGGLWWQAAGTTLCIAVGILDAWVLLVEILR